MATIRRIELNTFEGGVSDDVRLASNNSYEISQHFDIFSKPKQLIPYRKPELDETISISSTAMSVFSIKNFETANSKLWGLARVSDALGAVRIMEKTVPDGDWSLSATGTDVSGARGLQTFSHYKNNIYGFRSSQYLWRYGDITGTRAFTNTFGDTGANDIANSTQGHIAQDDKFYVGHNNKLSSVNSAGTFTAAVLTLPDNLYLTDLDDYKTKLAIGTRPKNIAEGTSKLFTWDLVSDDISDVIDWGEGDLKVVGNVEGVIIGVAEIAGGTSVNLDPKAVVSMWAGGSRKVIKEISLVDEDGNTYSVNQGSRKKGNKLYFSVVATAGGSQKKLQGVWVIGRKKEGKPISTTIDRYVNDTSSAVSIHNFIFVGDYFWTSHGATPTIQRTDNAANFTEPNMITQKYGDPLKEHTLLALGVSHLPLTSGQSVKVEYRVNEATAWATLMTSDKLNSLKKVATQAVGIGNFKTFGEIQFRVISIGGAVPTGLRGKYVDNDSEL